MQLKGVILVSIFAVYLVKPVTPYLEYVLNKDYIVKVLCINKDKPELKCNGKCHLKSELEKQNQEEKSPQRPIQVKNETIQLWTRTFFSESIIYTPETVTKLLSIVQITYRYIHVENIFHPPD